MNIGIRKPKKNTNEVMETVISVIGFIMLWAPTEIGRKEDSKLKFMGRKWWLTILVLIVGAYLARNFG